MIFIPALIAVCYGVCLPLFMSYKRKQHFHLAACYKTLGTLSTMIPALVACLRLSPDGGWFCVAALVLYSAADFTLEFNLYVGAGLFMAGHILLIAFFTHITPIGTIHLVVLVALVFIAVICFYRWRKQIGKQLPVFSVYTLILVLMCSCAVGCSTANTTQGFLIAFAGGLFVISDFLLLRRIIFPSGRLLNWLIMITYYLSLFLISVSFFA